MTNADGGQVPGGAPVPELGPGGGREIERIMFFSDAVMAIAITLLVIELRVPESLAGSITDADLRAAVADLGTPLLSVLLSFMVIAVWWVGHDRLFRTLDRIDGRLVVLNFAFLGAIAFLPFPTTLIGRFVELPTAVAIYAATNAVAGGSIFLMRWHADRRGYLREASTLERRRRLAQSAIAPVGFVASVPLAFVNAGLVAIAWLLFIPASGLVRWWFAREEHAAVPDAGSEPDPGP